jgi:hypothetical protein
MLPIVEVATLKNKGFSKLYSGLMRDGKPDVVLGEAVIAASELVT